MKRKSWSPDDPRGELRGKDEWERISWDEALDIVADQTKRIVDTYGPSAVFIAAYDLPNAGHYDDNQLYVQYLMGAGLVNKWGTISWGSWPLPEMFMTGGLLAAPDAAGLMQSDLQVHFGCNWASNKAGNAAYRLTQVKGDGKIVIVDPWLNQTAEGIADEWIPVRPGTDTAFVLGMAHHMITNNLQNQKFLDTYCVGFDSDHMPEGADPKENFKDYVLGTYDGEPKTPEWASMICGTPVDRIRGLAEEIASTENVAFFAAFSSTKIPAGEMFAQAFYTLSFMYGVGTPGNYASWIGPAETVGPMGWVSAGDWADTANAPANPLMPEKLGPFAPDFSKITDWDAWDYMEFSETWQSILNGEYGRDSWPGGKKPLDVHMIYSCGGENALNSNPNANAGIEAFRKMDFVVSANPWFCATARYADVVLPVATWWEKDTRVWGATNESIFWHDHIMDAPYEARSEREIGRLLAERLNLSPDAVDTASTEKRLYQSAANSVYLADAMQGEYRPLFTLTEEDVAEIGYAEGVPQEGLVSFREFKEKGYYAFPRSENDGFSPVPWAAFIADPEGAPLATSSGKFEICCQALAAVVNGYGFSTISPIAKWQIADPNQGQGTQTDEYPLLLWTPHSLRRAHTINDSVVSLREAFPQECFMSVVDAEARGIKTGDPVLMTSPHGKVLRPAKVLPTIVPGAVALQDGAWMNIDEETGIDIGGNPNILQAPAASGQGSQSWTGTLVQVEKYMGDIELLPDKERPLVLPVGVE